MSSAWFNLIPQLPDFAGAGLGYAVGGMNNERYKRSVRHLRRREYQDMVFSLRQAGLNPALAYGATPGHAGGFPGQGYAPGGGGGVGSAIAANVAAEAGASLAPSQIEANTASAAEKRATAETQRWTRARMDADIAATRQGVAESIARTRATGAQQALYEAQAEQAGFNTKEVQQRIREIDAWGLPGQLPWRRLWRGAEDAAPSKSNPWDWNKPAENLIDGIGNTARGAYDWLHGVLNWDGESNSQPGNRGRR